MSSLLITPSTSTVSTTYCHISSNYCLPCRCNTNEGNEEVCDNEDNFEDHSPSIVVDNNQLEADDDNMNNEETPNGSGDICNLTCDNCHRSQAPSMLPSFYHLFFDHFKCRYF